MTQFRVGPHKCSVNSWVTQISSKWHKSMDSTIPTQSNLCYGWILVVARPMFLNNPMGWVESDWLNQWRMQTNFSKGAILYERERKREENFWDEVRKCSFLGFFFYFKLDEYLNFCLMFDETSSRTSSSLHQVLEAHHLLNRINSLEKDMQNKEWRKKRNKYNCIRVRRPLP